MYFFRKYNIKLQVYPIIEYDDCKNYIHNNYYSLRLFLKARPKFQTSYT